MDLWKRGMGRIMLVPKASVAYDLHAYSEIRQDGGRTIPHPIGLESSPSSAKFGADSNDGRTRGIFGFWRNEGEVGSRRAKVEWKDTPPKEVANHDYAWWHEKERWGPWNEA